MKKSEKNALAAVAFGVIVGIASVIYLPVLPNWSHWALGLLAAGVGFKTFNEMDAAKKAIDDD